MNTDDNTLPDDLDDDPIETLPSDDDLEFDDEPMTSVIDDFMNNDIDKVKDAIKQQAIKHVAQMVYGDQKSDSTDDDLDPDNVSDDDDPEGDV